MITRYLHPALLSAIIAPGLVGAADQISILPTPDGVARELARKNVEAAPLTITHGFDELMANSLERHPASRGSRVVSLPTLTRMETEFVDIDLVFRPNGGAQPVLVFLNNREIATLDPASEQFQSGRVVIRAEAEFLNDTHNFLEIATSDDAFVEHVVDLRRSRLHLTGAWSTRALRLGMLDRHFGAKEAKGEAHLHLCLPGSEIGGLRQEELEWGSIATQGAALRMGNLTPLPTHGVSPDQNVDNLLIGVARDIAPLIPEDDVRGITGPYVGVTPVPGAPHRLMVVLSGRTPAEVSQSVLSFGLIKCGYPGHLSNIVIDQVHLPMTPAFIRKPPLFAGSQTTLANLGFKTEPYRENEIPEFRFNLPLDVFAIGESGSAVDLKLEYWCPVTPANPLNFDVMVNGTNVASVTLAGHSASYSVNVIEVSSDQSHQRAELPLQIPIEAFEAGMNELSIVPRVAQDRPMARASGRFALFDSSSISLPGSEPAVELPDLALTRKTAFPFVPHADGSNLEVALLDPGHEAVNAGWMMTAKLAQVSNTLLYNASIHRGIPIGDRQTLLIGSLETLSPDLLLGAPMSATELSYQIGPEGGALFQFGTGGDWKAGYSTVTVLTTMRSANLMAVGADLVREENWRGLGGDLALWAPNRPLDAFEMTASQPLFVDPEIQPVQSSTVLGSNGYKIQPLHWAALLLALAIPFSLVTRALIAGGGKRPRPSGAFY
ncbi:MAG: cellulose biosynthesis cyclic di-GMP-binding regulatory protein BcsB [Verrucomicrobiota bacterium]